MFTQPATGATFTFAVPDEAKGMTLSTEVMVYDKDSWGDHKGFHIDDTANAYFGKGETGANDVGAQSKYKVLDWESTDVWYFGDHVMEALLAPSSVASLAEKGATASIRWDYFVWVGESAYGLGHDALGALPLYASPPYYGLDLSDPLNLTLVQTLGGDVAALGLKTLPDKEAIARTFAKTYKGTELERDLWFFTKDFDSDPDMEPHIVPYIADPHNVYDSWLYFVGFMNYVADNLDAMLPLIVSYNATCHATLFTHDPSVFAFLNSTAASVLYSIGYSQYIGGPSNVAALCGVVAATIPQLSAAVRASRPDKKNYLTGVLRAGLPVYAPVDKYWEKVLDDFNINDELVWMDSLFQTHKGGIKLEGKTVVVEMEWVNVWDDHEGTLEEREEYEERYTYGDTGGQSVISFVDGSEEFYRIESLSPAIPGYEITIFLAAAAISALGLIYVVMKKRRK
ncbi:MAG: hypothetical protein ACFFAH_10115 [Promethearchaeota archaeon]